MYAHYACYYALHALCSLLAVYVTISLLEYLIHRHLMHRPRVAKFFDSSYLLATFNQHMDHHAHCYEVFNHEEGPCGLLNLTVTSLTELIVVAIPAVIFYFIDPFTAGLLIVGALVHGFIWSAVHTEMHRPEKTWFSDTAFFRALNRFHFLHHRHMGTNFNTLFLGWDLVFRTVAKETAADRLEIVQDSWRVRVRNRHHHDAPNAA